MDPLTFIVLCPDRHAREDAAPLSIIKKEIFMQYEGPELTAIAVSRLSWPTLTDAQLAAAYLSATFGGRPRISPQVIAFEPARKLNLADAESYMHDLCFQGLKLAASRLT